MPQFVVLLRGVNVGKGNRVPMATFRSLLEALGFRDIATLLNSGNAVFRSARRSAGAHAKAIGSRLEQALGVRVLVVVKSSAEFLAAVSENPVIVPEEHHSRLLVAFAQEELAIPGLSRLSALLEPPEQLHVGTHAGYLYCFHGILDSKLGRAVLGKAGRQVTTRNWATVLKLAVLLHEAPLNPSIERTSQEVAARRPVAVVKR